MKNDFYQLLPTNLGQTLLKVRQISLQHGMSCAEPDSFVIGGPSMTTFLFYLFFAHEQIPLHAGHHRPTSEWCFAGGSIMAQH